jgi:hypothetical protein
MARRNFSHERRESSRSVDAWAGPFMPSFSVRRHVELADGSAEEVHKRLKRVLRMGRNRFQGYVVAPEQLCLVMVEQRSLINQMRRAKIQPEQSASQNSDEPPFAKKVENVAVSLQLGLSKLLQNSDNRLELRLDNPRPLKERKTVGCLPAAWRGYSANYYRRGHHETPLTEAKAQKPEFMSPNQLLIAEKNLCIGAVASLFAEESKPFDATPFYSEPHVAFVHRNAPITPSQFQSWESKLDDIIPESVTLSDPVVYVQLERTAEPLELKVWPREEYGGEFRLAA